MKKALLAGGFLLLAFFLWRGKSQEYLREREEQAAIIERLERENGRLRARIAGLEADLKTKPANQTTPPPANPTPQPIPQTQQNVGTQRIVDVPPPGSPVCTFATINSTTQLAYNLTWDTIRGGTYVGELPAGSIIEILYGNLYIWNDYPDEHALYVKVVESPTSDIIGKIGYIELRRINFRRCNLGAEYEK